MSDSLDPSDKLFWLAYCDLIKRQIGGDLGKNEVILFCTANQRGPPAGDPAVVDPSYTNTGIYELADQLLEPDSLFYSPSPNHSYYRSVIEYMDYVDLGGDPSVQELLDVRDKTQAVQTLQAQVQTQLQAAFAQYNQSAAMNMTGGQSFAEWCVVNAPAYDAVNMQYQAASAALTNALQQCYGPLAAQYTRDLNRMVAANDSLVSIPGVNMPCTSLTPDSVRAVLNNLNSNNKTPPPSAIYYRPDYHSPQYCQAVRNWQSDANNPQIKPQTFTITINTGKRVSESDFRQRPLSSGTSFSYVPWISFAANASNRQLFQYFPTHSEASEITIEVSWNATAKVALSPGTWDIGSPSDAYKLKADAPSNVQTLVRPTQLLIGSNVVYKVRFGTQLASSFDKQVKSTSLAGGSVNIFGVPISLSASGSSSAENTTHTGSWDSSAGEFTVTPTNDVGFATVLAVIGQQISCI